MLFKNQTLFTLITLIITLLFFWDTGLVIFQSTGIFATHINNEYK